MAEAVDGRSANNGWVRTGTDNWRFSTAAWTSAGRQEAEKHESNGCATAPAYPSGGWLLLGLSLLGRRARGSQDG